MNKTKAKLSLFKFLLIASTCTVTLIGPSIGYSATENKSFLEKIVGEEIAKQQFHMGLDVGVNSPKGSADPAPSIGVNIGYQPIVPFGLGAELNTSRLEDTKNHQRTSLLVKGSYNFSADLPIIKYSYLGLGVGPTIIPKHLEWSLAPLAGFDIPLRNLEWDFFEKLSLGVNAMYMMTTNSPNSLVMNGAVKYWF